MAYMPRDVAGIVRSYVSPVVKLIRPFRRGRCMVCGTSYSSKHPNLCVVHEDLCGVCGGPHKKCNNRDSVCPQCYESFPWLPMVGNPSEHLMARLYAHRDELDFEKLDRCGSAIEEEMSRLEAAHSAACDAHQMASDAIRDAGDDWELYKKRVPDYVHTADIGRSTFEARHAYGYQRMFNRLLAEMEDMPLLPLPFDERFVPPARIEKNDGARRPI
jgi:hypothetical protein